MANSDSKNIKEHFENLEETFSYWGEREPYFSVLTAPTFLFNNMSEQDGMNAEALQHFYSLGERDISFAFEILAHNKITINPTLAFDFGCGLGRLTFALAKSFRFVIGCDVSDPHLEIARINASNSGINNVHFIKSSSNLLDILSPGSFDFIYSRLVLQHIPPALSLAYIRQFASLLKLGGYMLIQLPTATPNYVFNPEAERNSEFSKTNLDAENSGGERATDAGKHNIQMFSLEIKDVLKAINAGNCELIDLVLETDKGGWTSNVFLAKKRT